MTFFSSVLYRKNIVSFTYDIRNTCSLTVSVLGKAFCRQEAIHSKVGESKGTHKMFDRTEISALKPHIVQWLTVCTTKLTTLKHTIQSILTDGANTHHPGPRMYFWP